MLAADLKSRRRGVTIDSRDIGLPFPSRRPWSQVPSVIAALGAIAVLTAAYVRLGVTNTTIVALSFLLTILIVATVSVRWVAVSASLLAFCCFNYFFLPPVGTWTIADPQNWVALFTLLAVSLIASHLSAQARERIELLEERKEAEVVRREAELKSALLASLSHDLKTPLTAVTVAANNLDASCLSPQQRREQAEIVQAELARLNRMFEDIVDMARIETHAVAAAPEWVQPEEIIEAATRHAGPAVSGHRLETRIPADSLVRLDPRLTSAALAHLLENAAQYSPAGSTIAIDVTVQPNELSIAVRDHGPGIAPEDLEYLFERFYRGAAARERRFGTGMGLPIARGLLAAQDGGVVAANDPGGGARFTITVPVAVRAAETLNEEPA